MQKVWLLNMHPRNLATVAHCQELMSSVGGFLWSLEKEGKRLTFKTKEIVLHGGLMKCNDINK